MEGSAPADNVSQSLGRKAGSSSCQKIRFEASAHFRVACISGSKVNIFLSPKKGHVTLPLGPGRNGGTCNCKEHKLKTATHSQNWISYYSSLMLKEMC